MGKQSDRRPKKVRTARQPQPSPPPKPVQKPPRPEETRGWDGSIVIKEDIFGNKWAST